MICLGRKSSWITEVESNGYSQSSYEVISLSLEKKDTGTCRSTPRNAIPQKSVTEGDLRNRWWPKAKMQGQCCLSGGAHISCEHSFLPPDRGSHPQDPSDQSIAQVRKFKTRGIENESLISTFSIFFSLSLYFSFPRAFALIKLSIDKNIRFKEHYLWISRQGLQSEHPPLALLLPVALLNGQ